MSAVKWSAIAILLFASSGVGRQWAHFEMPVRGLVTLFAVAVLIEAIEARHYFAASTFAALALLYNPLFPVFGFAGDKQSAALIVSAFPFAAALTWPKESRTGQMEEEGNQL